jgi:hypothetical protein
MALFGLLIQTSGLFFGTPQLFSRLRTLIWYPSLVDRPICINLMIAMYSKISPAEPPPAAPPLKLHQIIFYYTSFVSLNEDQNVYFNKH